MLKLKVVYIHVMSLVWLLLGIIVFLIGWCEWYVSVPIVLISIYVLCHFVKKQDCFEVLSIGYWRLALAMFIICFILVLCGIGGYVVQPNDHFGRNAIYADIVNYDWPVYNDEQKLYMCYYLAFWMVPSLFGKLFHSLDIAHFAQLVWMAIGMLLLWMEICIKTGKVKIGVLFMFYFFAGMKVFECLLYFPFYGDDVVRSTVLTLATNGSPGAFHAGPMIQLLHDPFNQTIPLFLAMMLILNNKQSSFIGFIYSLVLLYAPFPFIGMAPFVVFLVLKSTNWESWNSVVRSWFTLPNITAVLILLVTGLFLVSNINGSHKGIRPSANILADIHSFILYLIFEFGIFMIIGYKACQDKKILWIGFVSICVFGWFQVGLHNDFCFRSNMPFIFLIALLVISRFYMEDTTKRMKIGIVVLLLIGGLPAQIHSMLRYISTYYVYVGKNQTELNKYQSFYDVTQMYVMQRKTLRDEDLHTVFNSGEWEWMTQSFKGTPDSFFFKYLAK